VRRRRTDRGADPNEFTTTSLRLPGAAAVILVEGESDECEQIRQQHGDRDRSGRHAGQSGNSTVGSGGAAVVAVDLDEKSLQEVVEQLEAEGGKAQACAADVSEEVSVRHSSTRQ
jgi:hypothetical protein